MSLIPPAIQAELSRIADDRTSGATALVLRGIEVLAAVRGETRLLLEVGRALCRAQPSMAGFRTAAAVALASPAGLGTLAHRVGRAPAAIARLVVPILTLRRHRARPVTIVTCSRSEAVEAAIRLAAAREAVVARCAESRPGREGAALARTLAEAGVTAELYSDAGISAAVAEADGVLVGADALSDRAFINKVGTGALCARAREAGVPVYVLAGREKILPDALFLRLPLREGPAAEVASEPGVSVRNPYFERVSLDLVISLVTDTGLIASSDIAQASIWHDMSLMNACNMLDSD